MLGQRDEVNAQVVELREGVDELLGRAGEAIEFPDQDYIHFAVSDMSPELGEFGV